MMEPNQPVSPAAIRDISQLSTGADRAEVALVALREAKLRAENRIQDDPEILAKLGFKGPIPAIAPELMAEAARANGTLVLDFGVSLVDYAKTLNAALGEDKANLRLRLWVSGYAYAARVTEFSGKIACVAESSGKAPQWKIVPNTVREDTLGLSKTAALEHVPGSQTCEPRDTALMLGYNNLQTGEQMPGFKNVNTFTSQENTLVGSYVDGIRVSVDEYRDGNGAGDVGLAPRLPPESN